MTKRGVKGKYQRKANEKYEIYLNSMRRIINTNTHKTKSTNYNTVQVIYYCLDLGGTITVYCNELGTLNSLVAIIILMPSEQDFISHWFNGAHLHVSTSDRTPGGFSPSSSKVINASSIYEYYVIKSGYDENRLTKQNHSKALLNTDTVHY